MKEEVINIFNNNNLPLYGVKNALSVEGEKSRSFS